MVGCAVESGATTSSGALVVLDTNIVLDLWVFDEPEVAGLLLALQAGHARWIRTDAMRAELARVLGYAHVVRALQRRARDATQVLEQADRMGVMVPASRCTVSVRCADPDDQMFVDLALAHGACLISKDQAVLATRRRMALAGVRVCRHWE